MNIYLIFAIVAAIFIAKCNSGLIKLRDEISGLPTCDSTESNKKCMNNGDSGSYCIKNNKIYKNGYDECTLSSTYDLENSILLLDKYNNYCSGYGCTIAYRCTLGSNNYVDYCNILNGYIIKYDKAILCNGIDECEENNSFEECKEGDEGIIGQEMLGDYGSDRRFKLCFGTDGVLIPTIVEYAANDSKQYVAFITTKVNNNFGKHNANEIIVLNISYSAVYADSLDDGEEKYFINQTYQPSNPDSKPLIKCNGSNCVALDKPEVTDGEIYYIDGYNNRYIIICNSDRCTSEKKSTDKMIYPTFFIDGSNNKNIISCFRDGCISEEAKQGVYIQDKNNFDASKSLIKCTSDGCIYVDNKNVCAEAGDEGNVYSNRISISICTAEIVWKQIDLDKFNNKFLLSKDIASILFNIKVSDDYILITGEASSIVYEEKPVNGYYLNGDTTETDIPYIQCDSKSCTKSEISESCTEETIGTLIKDSNGYGLCLEENNVVSVTQYLEKYIYYNSKNNVFELKSDQYALISISPTSIKLKDLSSPLTYYLNTDKTKNSKPLIESKGSIYTYINSLSSKKAFYIDGDNKKNIITCEGSTCTSKAATFGYYLNGGEDKDKYNFIYCIYFHGCSKESIETSNCKNTMDVIKKDDKYYVCLTNSGDKITEIKVDDFPVPIYDEVLNSERISLFNGSYSGNHKTKFKIKIGNDGSVVLLTPASLPECINITKVNECVSEQCSKKCYPTAYGGEYCIGTDAIIRLTTALSADAYTCKAIDSKSTGFTSNNVSGNVKLHFFTEFYEIINEITPGMDYINIAYKCTYGSDNTVTSCEIASGSYIVNGNKVECTGYRQDYCTVTDKFDSTDSNSNTNPTGSNTNPTGTKSSSSPSVSTINDDNKNEGNSGAVSLYYRLPSYMFYGILFILTIIYYI